MRIWTLGFGAARGSSAPGDLHLLDYLDASGSSHPNISALSLIVLKGNGSQLASLRARALDAGVLCMDFTSTMTEGNYMDQLARTKLLPTEEITYYGILLYGLRDELTPLTRKFSLFR